MNGIDCIDAKIIFHRLQEGNMPFTNMNNEQLMLSGLHITHLDLSTKHKGHIWLVHLCGIYRIGEITEVKSQLFIRRYRQKCEDSLMIRIESLRAWWNVLKLASVMEVYLTEFITLSCIFKGINFVSHELCLSKYIIS